MKWALKWSGKTLGTRMNYTTHVGSNRNASLVRLASLAQSIGLDLKFNKD